MFRQPISKKWTVALGVASIVGLMLVYSAISFRRHQVNPKDTTIPNAAQLAQGVVKICKPRTRTLPGTIDAEGNFQSGREVTTFFESWIWRDSIASASRLSAGLLIGALAAIVLGILMGCYAVIEGFFNPPIAFLAKIPPTAMLAIFFVLVGTGFGFYAWMIAFGVFPTLTQAVHYAVRENVPDELIDKGRTLGASQIELIWDVVFKQVLPVVLESVRLQIGPAMVYLIAAEWVQSDVGLGYTLRMQSRLLEMNVVYVYLVILGLTGFGLDQVFRLTVRKMCPWYGMK